MPSATPRGYPYPLGTDRVMDGDDAIHSLADAIDSKLGGPQVNGSVPMPAVAAGASSTAAVTFPAGRFTAPPVVFCQTGHGRVSVSPSSVTATGFVYGMSNWTTAGSTAQSGFWHAEAPLS